MADLRQKDKLEDRALEQDIISLIPVVKYGAMFPVT
jgi:hypothetical protein